MSTAWVASEIMRMARHRDPLPESQFCRYNPRPAGVIRPGSASAAVLELLSSRPGQWLYRHQIISITGRTRKSVDWALIYLETSRLIEGTDRAETAPKARKGHAWCGVNPATSTPAAYSMACSRFRSQGMVRRFRVPAKPNK